MRRQQQLDALQTQRIQLQRKYNDSAINDRDVLLQNPTTSNAEEDSDTAPIIDTNDVQALKQHQIDILEEQNRGLETLSQTLSRQKNLATQLGQEVEEQNGILEFSNTYIFIYIFGHQLFYIIFLYALQIFWII